MSRMNRQTLKRLRWPDGKSQRYGVILHAVVGCVTTPSSCLAAKKNFDEAELHVAAVTKMLDALNGLQDTLKK